jgi:hypothetical protein
MPSDWNILWSDSGNLLQPVLGAYYNKYVHKTFVTLFREGDLKANENKLTVKEFANILLRLPLSSFDSRLVFNNFQETNYLNAGLFKQLPQVLNIIGFRRAKYTEYDYTLKQYKKHHYVRLMLFNDELDRRG